MGLRNRSQRLSRSAALGTRNIDVIRPPPGALLRPGDKGIVNEEHLTVQMSPDRLTLHTLTHGHQEGDAPLRRLAQALAAEALAPRATAARNSRWCCPA